MVPSSRQPQLVILITPVIFKGRRTERADDTQMIDLEHTLVREHVHTLVLLLCLLRVFHIVELDYQVPDQGF